MGSITQRMPLPLPCHRVSSCWLHCRQKRNGNSNRDPSVTWPDTTSLKRSSSACSTSSTWRILSGMSCVCVCCWAGRDAARLDFTTAVERAGLVAVKHSTCRSIETRLWICSRQRSARVLTLRAPGPLTPSPLTTRSAKTYWHGWTTACQTWRKLFVAGGCWLRCGRTQTTASVISSTRWLATCSRSKSSVS